MEVKLSRARARVSIILLAAALVLLFAALLSNKGLPAGLGVAAAAAAMLVRQWKCPNCGRRISPRPQWGQPGKYHCPCCGNRFVYDDEEAVA